MGYNITHLGVLEVYADTQTGSLLGSVLEICFFLLYLRVLVGRISIS